MSNDAHRPAGARADPVAEAILAALEEAGPGRSLSPMEIARLFAGTRMKPGEPPDPERWRRYLPAVRQQALHLARVGRIQVLHKGKPVAPGRVKGVVRLALPPP